MCHNSTNKMDETLSEIQFTFLDCLRSNDGTNKQHIRDAKMFINWLKQRMERYYDKDKGCFMMSWDVFIWELKQLAGAKLVK